MVLHGYVLILFSSPFRWRAFYIRSDHHHLKYDAAARSVPRCGGCSLPTSTASRPRMALCAPVRLPQEGHGGGCDANKMHRAHGAHSADRERGGLLHRIVAVDGPLVCDDSRYSLRLNPQSASSQHSSTFSVPSTHVCLLGAEHSHTRKI